jgi:hypothetical protein
LQKTRRPSRGFRDFGNKNPGWSGEPAGLSPLPPCRRSWCISPSAMKAWMFSGLRADGLCPRSARGLFGLALRCPRAWPNTRDVGHSTCERTGALWRPSIEGIGPLVLDGRQTWTRTAQSKFCAKPQSSSSPHSLTSSSMESRVVRSTQRARNCSRRAAPGNTLRTPL